MKKHSKLTNEERRVIINLHSDGQSYRKIAKFIGKTVASVFKAVKAYKEEGRLSHKGQSGRPRKTTNRMNLRIKANRR